MNKRQKKKMLTKKIGSILKNHGLIIGSRYEGGQFHGFPVGSVVRVINQEPNGFYFCREQGSEFAQYVPPSNIIVNNGGRK